ncbi:PLDc N-terminal domain-containing protein [Adhaeribacter pallidiroseus]|uniref:Cardiolipin synthase N-terminal domain-containing protein n=1 Tax=Adhaeribacter pallidiroseus TaxID=2072847 RepID=A0A369QQ73_9BACT|nr:PLD nuclease N-terminal domain-containing protein [Adhaeribacter pallidiroseus]RDC65825.1 hypothetical protein AHMF7616_04455 [Adhaeribacter pallidiroseus]
MMLYIGGLGTLEILVISVLVLVPLIFMLWALVEVLRSDFKDSTTKLLWVLVILFITPLGWILYFLIGRKQRLTT